MGLSLLRETLPVRTPQPTYLTSLWGSPFLRIKKLTGSTAAVQAHADPASSSKRSGGARRAILGDLVNGCRCRA